MFLQVPLLTPCFQEKTYHLHKLCIIKRWSKILRPLMSLLFLTKKDNTSKARIKIYAQIGSPWRVPLSRWKYWVVLPPLIAQDSFFEIKVSTQLTKLLPKPNFFQYRNDKSNDDLMNRRLSRYTLLLKNLLYWERQWSQWCLLSIYRFHQ